MMYGDQITEALKRDPITRRTFGGVLAADELRTFVGRRPKLFVVNTDVRGMPGKHWTAFYFPKMGPSEFFDPLGHRPEHYRQTFKSILIKLGPNYTFNKVRVQPKNTRTCGQYCVQFAKLRCRGWPMKRIVVYLQRHPIVYD